MSCPCFICLAMYNLYFWCIAIIIRQATKTTTTRRYLQIFILFVQGWAPTSYTWRYDIINPYKWPTNEWGNWGYGAICCPWPCTTYQEVVSESTVLAALEDEGAEGSEAEAYNPRGWSGWNLGTPVVLEELFEVDFVELDRGIPKCWDIMWWFFFVSWEVCMYDSFVMDFFFRKNHQDFQSFSFWTPNWTLEKT